MLSDVRGKKACRTFSMRPSRALIWHVMDCELHTFATLLWFRRFFSLSLHAFTSLPRSTQHSAHILQLLVPSQIIKSSARTNSVQSFVPSTLRTKQRGWKVKRLLKVEFHLKIFHLRHNQPDRRERERAAAASRSSSNKERKKAHHRICACGVSAPFFSTLKMFRLRLESWAIDVVCAPAFKIRFPTIFIVVQDSSKKKEEQEERALRTLRWRTGGCCVWGVRGSTPNGRESWGGGGAHDDVREQKKVGGGWRRTTHWKERVPRAQWRLRFIAIKHRPWSVIGDDGEQLEGEPKMS